MQKDPLKIAIRSNRETDELITVKWSAEIATPWSKYESLAGQISITPGEDSGSIEISDEHFEEFPKNFQKDAKIEKPGLDGVFQMVLRLEGLDLINQEFLDFFKFSFPIFEIRKNRNRMWNCFHQKRYTPMSYHFG